MTTRIAVLGAGGFVGQEVVRALAESADVIAVTRRPASFGPAIESRVLPTPDWERAVAGVDIVVHLIARTHQPGKSPPEVDAYREVNVETTRQILRACEAQGVRRVVFVSSIKAMGESRDAPYTEDDVCRPQDTYGRTKLEAEGLVRASPVDSVILRPPLVYGPRARGNVARLMHALRRGIPLPLARATAPRSLIAVENLASALLVAVDHPAAVGRTYLVSDQEVLTVRRLVEVLAEGVGRPARLVPVPVPLLRAAGAALRRTDEIDRLVRPLTLDTSRIQGELGWTAPTPACDALLRAARSWP